MTRKTINITRTLFAMLIWMLIANTTVLADTSYTPAEAAEIIKPLSDEVITALSNRDLKKLSQFVHPVNGLSFSPYAYVEVDVNMVFSFEELQELDDSTTIFTWGVYDGSGLPIRLSFWDYFDQFVYNRDYITIDIVGYNEVIGEGNSIINHQTVYPEGIYVEYHAPAQDPYGVGWDSLRMIFQTYQGEWYLRALIHDGWTV